MSYIIDKFDFIPYRDFFDMNMVGSYYYYLIITKTFGYSDIGIRLADYLLLSSIIIIIYLTLKDTDKYAAITGGTIFAILYLNAGQGLSLQREFLSLPLLSLCLYFTISDIKIQYKIRLFLISLISGFIFTIKPHLAISYPFFYIYILGKNIRFKNFLKENKLSTITSIVLFLLPISSFLVYLNSHGALNDFLDIARNYWPLYSSINNDLLFNSIYEKIFFRLIHYFYFGGYPFLAAAAVFLYYKYNNIFISYDNILSKINLIALLCAIYSFYTLFTCQFWNYHWLPFVFFISIFLSFSFSKKIKIAYSFMVVFIVVLVIPIFFSIKYSDEVFWKKYRIDRVNRISAFLKDNLKPNETVQPLDWTGGAVHAMLLSKAKIATPFIYDFHFYYNLNTNYINDLRKKFINLLNLARPDYIVDITDFDKPYGKGTFTTRDFNELSEFKRINYDTVHIERDFIIYKKK